MKKGFKAFLMIAIVAIAAFAMIGCNNDPSYSFEGQVEGQTWTIASAEIGAKIVVPEPAPRASVTEAEQLQNTYFLFEDGILWVGFDFNLDGTIEEGDIIPIVEYTFVDGQVVIMSGTQPMVYLDVSVPSPSTWYLTFDITEFDLAFGMDPEATTLVDILEDETGLILEKGFIKIEFRDRAVTLPELPVL